MTEEPTTFTSPPETPAKTGPEVIAAYLKNAAAEPRRLPHARCRRRGHLCRQGADRCKARVSNYARLDGHTNRIARMILATASMEFVTVGTEAEALLLEANLIKRFRPRFNVLMRDDKSFPYILIAATIAAPAVMKHRGARNRKGDYFGPFASAGAVNRTVNMLQRAFLLRSCSDSVYESRTRPCLLYQIKRCSAPCTGEIGLDDYGELVDEAERFLSGKPDGSRGCTKQLMQEAADKLEFETRRASIATGSGRWRMSRQTSRSIRKASRKPTFSPPIRTAGRHASRSSSSAPARTGAIAPIFRRPTARSTSRRCSIASSRSSTTISRCRG